MNEQVKELDIPLNKPVDVVAVAVKTSAIRCKIISTDQTVTFRTVRDEVEGEILSIVPSKIWRFKNTHYMTGEIQSKRVAVPDLNLEPLSLIKVAKWNPDQEDWGEPDDPTFKYFEPVIEFGERDSFEIEQIASLQNSDNFGNNPIDKAVELRESGDNEGAFKIIENLLAADLRNIDAHAHLGNWEFNRSEQTYESAIDKAKRHYQVGVQIGELSLDQDFNGLLPWGCIDNRPFLRCLHGYGLSLWRLGLVEEARSVFERMLWLNPSDNQGIRFLLNDIDEGRSWEECDS